MSEWELDNIEELYIREFDKLGTDAEPDEKELRVTEAIAKAAQRKLVDWLREPCHKHNAGMLRLGCAECWRNLREGIYDE